MTITVSCNFPGCTIFDGKQMVDFRTRMGERIELLGGWVEEDLRYDPDGYPNVRALQKAELIEADTIAGLHDCRVISDRLGDLMGQGLSKAEALSKLDGVIHRARISGFIAPPEGSYPNTTEVKEHPEWMKPAGAEQR